MDHISYTIGKDPLSVRLANIDKTMKDIIFNFINDFVKWADVERRKKDIENYNKVDRVNHIVI